MVFIHNGILHSHEEELENIILSEVSLAQKTKNCMFSSYVDFRSRANTIRELDFDHMIR
jgi:hypothetical protein